MILILIIELLRALKGYALGKDTKKQRDTVIRKAKEDYVQIKHRCW